MTKIAIDIVSDVVCPWCYLGKMRVERAMSMVPEIEFDIRWRPYQLDPSIPQGGVERKAYMEAKFGDLSRLEQASRHLQEAGAAEGISFNFDAIEKTPNTLDAHRLIRWAASAPGKDTQNALAQRLFALYFEEAADIGDHAVLLSAAEDVGMDTAVVAGLLASPSDRTEVEEEIETSRRMGITGVPCFLIDGKYAVMGARDAEDMAQAFRQVAVEKTKGDAA
jgi:predicted DsbA family dithiol-disulfide isomerase